MMIHIFPVAAQENDAVVAISFLLAKDPEELTEDEVDQLSGLLKRKILLNEATREELYSCGILTRYQVASLLDYRERSGACMSFLELASLDGFTQDFVDRIKPFVTLESYPELKGSLDNEFTARASLRSTTEQTRYGYTSRYKLKYGDALKASLACSRALDAKTGFPDAVCGSIETQFKRFPASLIIGDFNARFGQGLAMWTGSDFTSLNTPSAFMKRHFGVTSSTSYTGTNVYTGLAGKIAVRDISISAYVATPGIKTLRTSPQNFRVQPALNMNYSWRFGQAGLSHMLEFGGFGREVYIPAMKTSCDFSLCVKGIDVFSEFMFNWVNRRPSAVAGVVFPVNDVWNLAAMLRSHDSEHKIAVSSGMNNRKKLNGAVSTEAVLYTIPKDDSQSRSLQLKFHSQWQYMLSNQFQLTLRFTERIRSWGHMFRTDLRSDLSWKSDMFLITLRLNALQCDNYSFLAYIEGGYKHEKMSVYLRQGVFFIDDWDDRIYAYERDVPGAYNSPAFYGRGVWTSLMSSWKLTGWCRLYFRAGYTSYPFMQEKKPGKAELRFQSVFDF